MSGFFLVRRDAVDLDSPAARTASRSCSRSSCARPGCASPRSRSGSASATPARPRRRSREALRYLGQLWQLGAGQDGRRGSAASASSGATGLVVNTLLLALFADVLGINYVAAAILATQGSTLWNFCLTEAWVFRGREHRAQPGAARWGCSSSMNNVALPLRIPILFVLTSRARRPLPGLEPAVAGGAHGAALRDRRHAGSGARRTQRREPVHSYDIHGIVTVTSEVAAPRARAVLASTRCSPTHDQGADRDLGGGRRRAGGGRPSPRNGNGNGHAQRRTSSTATGTATLTRSS